MPSRLLRGAFFLAVLLSFSLSAWAHATKENARLPVVGPAPEFTLTTEAGSRLSLADLRGKVLAVTFIYATCTDTCPLLTAKMTELQRRLGGDFGARVRFVSITVDPEVDTPEVLRGYAKAHGANVEGWSFLTGTSAEIKDVIRRYGAYASKTARGSVDHLFLTSLIDRQGRLRVQYLGYRFKPDEMLADLQALLRE
jgi:protein SCO1/2